ncbi:polysaccharide pyruvyl transferase family protein [Polaribacter sp.]|uniref:polysaccharide pyruvyl transferase family protein n=1 Tax=Polaribacter sp. TaxID=1920175 RepID=UPI003F69A5E5
MKKVGILTFHDEPNYGAFLQTYALSEAVKTLGFDVKIIDLRIKDSFKYNLASRLFGPIIRYFIFEKARKKYLKRTKIYSSSEDLKSNPPDCDIFILGSDQVWNKDITTDIKYSFFFDFLKKNEFRFSYASSFGMNIWNFNNEETRHIKQLLSNFSSIAVRESTAVRLLKDNCDLDSTLVLDPTLLISDYSKITGRIKQKSNNMICFKFTKDEGFYPFLEEFKSKNDLSISIMAKTMPVKGFINIPLPSVKTWIKSIAQSEIVLTDSYHVLIFSIIFERQFIILPANMKNFNRLSELLTDLELSDRIFYSYKEVLDNDRWKNKIDFIKVKKLLAVKRNHSLSFLKGELNKL